MLFGGVVGLEEWIVFVLGFWDHLEQVCFRVHPWLSKKISPASFYQYKVFSIVIIIPDTISYPAYQTIQQWMPMT